MSQPNSLAPTLPFSANFTVKEASEVLAETAAIGRRLREKTALMEHIQPYLDSIGSTAKNTMQNLAAPPDNNWTAARNGLIGAGVGAGAGGLLSLGQPAGRRRSLSSMLQGALLGGAIGGGGTLALQHANVVGKLPDSAVHSRVKELERTILRNTARNQGDLNTAIQPELDALKERALTIPKAHPETPPPLGAQITSAASDIVNKQPMNAVQTLLPNPGEAAIDAAVGGGAGYVAGAGADRGMAALENARNAGSRLKTVPADEIRKAISNTDVASRVERAISRSPVGPTGYSPVPKGVQKYAPKLLPKAAIPAATPGTTLRRRGGIAGALLTPLLRPQVLPGAYGTEE